MNKEMKLFDDSQMISRKLPDQSEFEAALQNELMNFSHIIDESFAMMQREKTQKNPWFLDRNWEAITMSGNIRGLLHSLYPEFIKVDGCGRVYFKNDKRYILLFKKLNDRKLPSNIATVNSQKLYGQYAFPFEVANPIVFIGYTVNDSWEVITGKYAVCIKNDRIIWCSDVMNQESNRSVNINLPNVELEDLTKLIRIRVAKTS
jgi:hypothetical protein